MAPLLPQCFGWVVRQDYSSSVDHQHDQCQPTKPSTARRPEIPTYTLAPTKSFFNVNAITQSSQLHPDLYPFAPAIARRFVPEKTQCYLLMSSLSFSPAQCNIAKLGT